MHSSLLERRISLCGSSILSVSQLQLDAAVTTFSEEVKHPLSIAAMAAGGFVFKGTNLLLSRLASPLLAESGIFTRAISQTAIRGFSLSAEVGVFRSISQGPSRVFEGKEFATDCLSFGILRVVGVFAHRQNLIMTHLMQSTAMVSGRNLAYALGISIEAPQGSFAEQFAYAEAMNIKLGLAMSVVGVVTPGISKMERRIEIENVALHATRTPTLSLIKKSPILSFSAEATAQQKKVIDLGETPLELAIPWIEAALDAHEPGWRNKIEIENKDFEFILRPQMGREMFDYTDRLNESLLRPYEEHFPALRRLAEKIERKEALEESEIAWLKNLEIASKRDWQTIRFKVGVLRWISCRSHRKSAALSKVDHDLGRRRVLLKNLAILFENFAAQRTLGNFSRQVLRSWDKPYMHHLFSNAVTLAMELEEKFPHSLVKPELDPPLNESSFAGNFSQAHKLVDIISNLLSNAWRYRSSKPPKVELINNWLPDASLEVTLQDNGIGIERENIFRLGALGFREARKEVEGSHGDGLNAVIQNLRELGFGPLWVRSEVGVGSAFRFVIPAPFLIREGHAPTSTHNPRFAIEKSRLEGFYVPDKALDLLGEEK